MKSFRDYLTTAGAAYEWQTLLAVLFSVESLTTCCPALVCGWKMFLLLFRYKNIMKFKNSTNGSNPFFQCSHYEPNTTKAWFLIGWCKMILGQSSNNWTLEKIAQRLAAQNMKPLYRVLLLKMRHKNYHHWHNIKTGCLYWMQLKNITYSVCQSLQTF